MKDYKEKGKKDLNLQKFRKNGFGNELIETIIDEFKKSAS